MWIDLNTVDDEAEEEEEGEGEVVAAPTACSGVGSVCLELWHSYAGPRVWMPRKGSLVVYFPQGHLLDQLGDGGGRLAPGDLPPHVLCRVVDVNLQAAQDSDEVYAQLSLVAEDKELEQRLKDDEYGENGQVEESEDFSKSLTTHMFCKTLTASDTSTHGGFSVPRRAAEDCFPPLDYKQQRPSQELIAKDLHGTGWKFRHIYRGQPRRHLLTTGWSAFINKKKLVSGDAVLFLRGNDGELRLGIQRADQLKRSTSFPAFNGQKNPDTFSDVANAISTRKMFCINYNPRVNQSEFIIPYWKFTKSFSHSFSIGTRFKMSIDSEDAADKWYTGLVTGVGELDPLRWPGSKWKHLLVKWDGEVDINGDNRVSPWDIEPTGSVSLPSLLPTTGLKRTKFCHPADHLEHPIPDGIGYHDFGEPAGFLKVLQGQEIMGIRTLYEGIDVAKTDMRNNFRIPVGSSDFPYNGFGESVHLHEVLQGQEIDQLMPTFQGTPANAWSGSGPRVFDHLLGTQSSWARSIQEYNSLGKPSTSSAQMSSPSVLMFQQESTLPCPHEVYGIDKHDENDDSSSGGLFDTEKQMPAAPHNMVHDFARGQCGSAEVHETAHVSTLDLKNGNQKNCRLFGFSLTEMMPVPNRVGEFETESRSATEIHRETSLPLFKSQVPNISGRVIDHPKLGPYNDLRLGAV